MQLNTRYDYSDFNRTVRALKAARLQKGLSRKQAAELLGWTPRSFEQIENGRCNFSKNRLQKIIKAYGLSAQQFERILKDPKLVIANVCKEGDADRSVDRKPRRNHLKIITRDVRALRTLRKRKGISQYAASQLCGYAPSAFGHIEEGRIELRKDRIEHILKCLGFKWNDFEALVNAPVLRDEIIEDAIKNIHRLDDQALTSAVNVIKALVK